jgi:hypothetical protein
MIRFLHKLGNTDRRLTRQDRLLGYLLVVAAVDQPPHAKPMIIAMTAPPIRPQTPYLIFPAVSVFTDNTSMNYIVIFLPVMTLRRMRWVRSSALAVFFGYESRFHDETPFRNHREEISFFYSGSHE